MEMLVLLLLSTAIAVQGYGKSNDPNDEPFLPIYPVYPYSPKLIKRGAERESVSQLSPELYAPKVDAKDSYSVSYSTNYPRDPYYSNYNSYPKASTPSSYSYSTLPYTYPTAAYSDYNSYSTPYAMAPPPSYSPVPYSASYPNYYYQPPYYYPNYYTQPLYPPPPMPPPADYSNDPYSDSNDKEKKKPSGDNRYRGQDADHDSMGNQYVDGGNYISGNGKDLDGQSSTYKTSSPRNQLEQVSEVRVKTLQIPLPTTSYRVISVAGQPVGPDYPLPAPYLKAQQLEELMSQTWAKMMAQNLQQQAAQYRVNEANKDTQAGTNDGQYSNQNGQAQRFVSVPNVIAKTGLAYIVNPNILGKLNIGQGQLLQNQASQVKAIKYPLTPGVYTAVEKPGKDQTDSGEYENYENPSSQGGQDYDGSLSQTDKQTQNYENDQGQYYQNQNFVTAQTPRGYNYQYSGYPSQTTAQQQSQQYKNNLEDVNFGAKTKKG
ncbi:uncharacterized protein LOC128873486 [Hylaeus volcanicus]|uniref:uncharacterized protein LOC128873486 n=1 Tax=Hylaeus volcanicus TaxID=313075 RepID=UPI0023B817CF|nr:uncharacterized protein LOC128873486 [Hylaeus volcanicus]